MARSTANRLRINKASVFTFSATALLQLWGLHILPSVLSWVHTLSCIDKAMEKHVIHMVQFFNQKPTVLGWIRFFRRAQFSLIFHIQNCGSISDVDVYCYFNLYTNMDKVLLLSVMSVSALKLKNIEKKKKRQSREWSHIQLLKLTAKTGPDGWRNYLRMDEHTCMYWRIFSQISKVVILSPAKRFKEIIFATYLSEEKLCVCSL